jgi:hypothetical protein
MNLKLFTSAFVLILLVLSSVESNKQRQTTLIEILENIVNDPEYLALSDNQQLEVLVMIYTLLNDIYNQRKQQQHQQNGI